MFNKIAAFSIRKETVSFLWLAGIGANYTKEPQPVKANLFFFFSIQSEANDFFAAASQK